MKDIELVIPIEEYLLKKSYLVGKIEMITKKSEVNIYNVFRDLPKI